ncbi:MAG TPA: radical SAM protein [Actinopolymorphaceae bacterium]|jgi:23S rRNA (adenine-C8)-methyltransferase|nr:radical SAM protein [Actinopolymorphaceae bacterium]
MWPDLPAQTRYAALHDFLARAGEPAYRLRQILRAVHRRGITEFAEMTDLPRDLRTRLAAEFGASLLDLRPLAHQRGDQVEKVLFESRQGARIETVFAHYRSGFGSLCVSTQVGCGLGCTFCATGAVGLVRNLSADEICEQVLYFRTPPAQGGVDSVAFMGMGEALANPHTFPALRLLTHPHVYGLSPRRITVSTVGFAPGLQRLVEEHPQVDVTLSVHSPYDDERAELIPLQQRFPLAHCLDILDGHVAATRRKAYLAYLLIDGLNDTDDHATALAGLVAARRRPELFHVSVIPYNEAAGVNTRYRRPGDERVRGFLARLARHGVRATKRQQFGGDVDAACGQLHARYLAG